MTFHIRERFSALIILSTSTFIVTPAGLQPGTALTLPAHAQEGCRYHHSQDHAQPAFQRLARSSGHGLCHVLDLSGKQQILAGVSYSWRVLGWYQAAEGKCFAQIYKGCDVSIQEQGGSPVQASQCESMHSQWRQGVTILSPEGSNIGYK